MKLVFNPLTSKFDYVSTASDFEEWLLPPIIEWYDPTGGLPTDPDVGDRYGADGTAYGWTDGYVYEWDGSTWVETEPEEGFMLWALLELIFYVFFSGGWMEVGEDSYLRLDCSNDPLTGQLDINNSDGTPFKIRNGDTQVVKLLNGDDADISVGGLAFPYYGIELYGTVDPALNLLLGQADLTELFGLEAYINLCLVLHDESNANLVFSQFGISATTDGFTAGNDFAMLTTNDGGSLYLGSEGGRVGGFINIYNLIGEGSTNFSVNGATGDITSIGTINLTGVGASSLGGTFTAPNFISNVAIGTAPFACTSTTVNTNLNADLLDGNHSSAFALSAHTHNVLTDTDGDTLTVARSNYGGTNLIKVSASAISGNYFTMFEYPFFVGGYNNIADMFGVQAATSISDDNHHYTASVSNTQTLTKNIANGGHGALDFSENLYLGEYDLEGQVAGVHGYISVYGTGDNKAYVNAAGYYEYNRREGYAGYSDNYNAAFEGWNRNQGEGTVANQYGGKSFVQVASGGTSGNMYGFAPSFTVDGTITSKLYGFYAGTVSGTPTSLPFIAGFYAPDQTKGTLNYGLYVEAFTNASGNDYGIYNLSPTYLGGTIIRANGTIQPISLADASAANNSIYYSTTASKLVYKDGAGTVNNLY